MNQALIIAISRQYGSGGRLIGKVVAERLNLPFYDKEIIGHAALQSGVAESFLVGAEQGHRILSAAPDVCSSAACLPSLENRIYLAEREAMREFARKGTCVMVGRGAGEALQNDFPVMRVFVHADLACRKKRAIEQYGADEKNLEERIRRIDKKRAAYFRFYAGVDARQMQNYHLCIDSGALGINGAAEVIQAAFLAMRANGEHQYGNHLS